MIRSVISLFIIGALMVRVYAQPSISFTFDDGDTRDMPGYPSNEWNQLILGHLKKNNVQAAFFVSGRALDNSRGKQIIQAWNDDGHSICNHTYSHPNYSKTSLENFKLDFTKNDSLIRQFSNYTKLFRFPYLKEGETSEKINAFRAFLKINSYKNGHVTIDASDWYINSRLLQRLKENPASDIEGFRKFYLQHLYERAVYYENLAFNLTGRHIRHTLLLHHNLTSALFLNDLIAMFKEKGWTIRSAKESFTDEIFDTNTMNIPAGESLTWALAKQTGKFETVLRYPAEDSLYEKEKMDALGL